MMANVVADMQAERRAFLERLFEHKPAKCFIEIRPLNKLHGPPLKQSFHANVDSAERAVVASMDHGDDVYVGALPRTNNKNGTADNVAEFRWLWVDLDYGTAGHNKPSLHASFEDAVGALSALPHPTILVTTGGGLHAWWALRQHDRGAAECVDINKRIAAAVKGDANPTDAPRILRVPGTFNHKLETPRAARLITCGEDLYDIEEFDFLPPVQKLSPPLPFKPSAPSVGGRPFDRANDIPITDVMGWLGVAMHMEGAITFCACPVHRGSNTSQMQVGGKFNAAHCHGDCSKTYSGVDVTSAVLGISPHEAVNKMAERFGFEGFRSKPAEVVAIHRPAASSTNDWRNGLATTGKGKLEKEPGNVALILENDDTWKGVLVYNEMSLYIEASRAHSVSGVGAGDLGDIDYTRIRAWLTRSYNLTVGDATVREGVAIAARALSYHPVQRYLDGLRWDGVARIRDMVNVHLGNTGEIEATMFVRWMIAACARAFSPGCKADTSLILQGEQGMFKSTLFAVLAGGWYSNTMVVLRDKDTYLQMRSAWLYEFQEVDALMSCRDAESIKSLMTQAKDTFRAPYGKTVENHPRTSVTCGTTNKQTFLNDNTGDRRWWVIRVLASINPVKIAVIRDQLWAEAMAAYRSGEQWWLTAEEDAARAARSGEHSTVEDDPWLGTIESSIGTSSIVKMEHLLNNTLTIPCERQNAKAMHRVASILRHLGFENKKAHGRMVWKRQSA